MESDKAYEALINISRNKNFNLLSEYLQNSEPIKINLSPLPFVEYLASVVVSQQLSTKAAKTIWSRVQPIIQGNKRSQNIEAALHEVGLSKSKANYVSGLIQNSELSAFSFSQILILKKHTETGRTPDCTRLRIFGTVLKSENNTVQQYDLQNRRLVLFNLGTWGTEVLVSPLPYTGRDACRSRRLAAS